MEFDNAAEGWFVDFRSDRSRLLHRTCRVFAEFRESV